jgi:hypothetical protein
MLSSSQGINVIAGGSQYTGYSYKAIAFGKIQQIRPTKYIRLSLVHLYIQYIAVYGTSCS